MLDPKWAGRRVIAETRLRRNEQTIERAIKRALSVHQQYVMQAVRHQSLVASVTPDAFDVVSWDTTVDDEIVPVVSRVLTDLAGTTVKVFGLKPEVGSRLLGQIDVTDRARSFSDKVRTIGPDTASRVTEELTHGASQGESYDKLAGRINDIFDIAENSAARIARTETHGASEAISHDSAQTISNAGYAVTKTWISTEDNRTRPAHSDADGQTVDINEAFDIDGESLMFPGDPDGSPENVINCRCSQTFDLPDSVEGEPEE